MSGQVFSDEEWEKLYPLLQARVAFWIRTARVPLWTRQRESIMEDIVQDTLLKTLAYAKRAERGEACKIDSLENFSAVIAHNCFIDALRKDIHALPLLQDAYEPARYIDSGASSEWSEQAIENVHREVLFAQAARWIVKFPDKQRTAILIDLANKMYFDSLFPTPMQRAFVSAGIPLQEYQRPLPRDAGARARHAAHLSLAYKRLAELAYMQRYMLVA